MPSAFAGVVRRLHECGTDCNARPKAGNSAGDPIASYSAADRRRRTHWRIRSQGGPYRARQGLQIVYKRVVATCSAGGLIWRGGLSRPGWPSIGRSIRTVPIRRTRRRLRAKTRAYGPEAMLSLGNMGLAFGPADARRRAATATNALCGLCGYRRALARPCRDKASSGAMSVAGRCCRKSLFWLTNEIF
jgi:hypothetical protein